MEALKSTAMTIETLQKANNLKKEIDNLSQRLSKAERLICMDNLRIAVKAPNGLIDDYIFLSVDRKFHEYLIQQEINYLKAQITLKENQLSKL